MNLFRALVLMVGTLCVPVQDRNRSCIRTHTCNRWGTRRRSRTSKHVKKRLKPPVRMKAAARPDVSRQVRGLAPALVQPVERSEARSPERPVRILIGAASGAVWGLLTGLFTAGSSQPSQAFTNYVNRCLQERGYEVTGWQ